MHTLTPYPSPIFWLYVLIEPHMTKGRVITNEDGPAIDTGGMDLYKLKESVAFLNITPLFNIRKHLASGNFSDVY